MWLRVCPDGKLIERRVGARGLLGDMQVEDAEDAMSALHGCFDI
jgi:hypothetical protein